MRIAHIALKNFRSHLATEIDMPAVTVLRGPNHSGKSSIRHGIGLALVSHTDATDERGAGAASLIRTGENVAEVALSLYDPQNGTRNITMGLSLDKGRKVTCVNPDDLTSNCEDFLRWLGTQRDTLSCLIDTRYFIGKPPSEQKEILAGIILPKTYEFPKDRQDQCAEVGLKINWNLPPVDVIGNDKKGGYKEAYEARTGVNRAVKQFQMPSGDISAAGDEAEVKAKLDVRKNELAELRNKETGQKMAVAAHDQKIQASAQRLSSAEARLSTEQQEQVATKGNVLAKAKVTELEKVAKNEAKAKEVQTTIVAKTAEKTLRTGEVDALFKLSTSNAACPTCRQPITEEVMAGIMEPITVRIATLDAEILEAQQQQQAMGDWASAKATLDKHRLATEEIAKIDRRIAAAHDEVKAARTQQEELESTVAAVDPNLAGEIAEKVAAVERGNGILQKKSAANALKKAMDEAQDRQAKLLKDQTTLEKLVEYFGTGPTSAMTKLLASSIEPFESQMNEVLLQWGYECKLNFEPYAMLVKQTGAFKPLHILSESEQYQFAIAFQVALARTSGLMFIIVDATEIFDAAGRKGMMLGLVNAGLDHVIIIATDERTSVPTIPDSAFYMLSCVDQDGIPTTSMQQII